MDEEWFCHFSRLIGLNSNDRESYLSDLAKSNQVLSQDLAQFLSELNQKNLESNHGSNKPWLLPIPTELNSHFIPNFELIGLLGSGGMGEVYLAKQKVPSRWVALKRVKGLASEHVLRFREEVELLSRLEHPGVARMYEFGNDQECPYYTMEYVPGLSICSYANKYQLTFEERIRLFLQVLESVSYIHSKGIIHRDIKPGNILIKTSDRTVRLIDFGIATTLLGKLSLSQDPQSLNDCSFWTPGYGSPEQQTGQVLGDIKMDIYSLGITLFELMTGIPPSSLPTYQECQNTRSPISFSEWKTSNSFQNLKSTYKLKNRTQLFELEIILKKATNWHSELRYATANNFANDLIDLLEQRPISCLKNNVLYVYKKKLSRYFKTFVLSSLIVISGILIGIKFLRYHYENDRQNKALLLTNQRALAESERLAKSMAFILDTVQAYDPLKTEQSEITLDKWIEHCTKRIQGNFPTPLKIKIGIGLAQLQLSRGKAQLAEDLIDELEIEIQKSGSVPVIDIQDFQFLKAKIHYSHGNYQLADLQLSSLEEEWKKEGSHPNLRYAEWMRLWGLVALQSREPEKGLLRIDKAIALFQSNKDLQKVGWISTCAAKATTLSEMGETERALQLFAETQAYAMEELGSSHAITLNLMSNKLRLLLEIGGDLGQEELASQLLHERILRMGEEHAYIASARTFLAFALYEKGKVDQAIYQGQLALDWSIRNLRSGHPQRLGFATNQALFLKAAERPIEALEKLRVALREYPQLDEISYEAYALKTLLENNNNNVDKTIATLRSLITHSEKKAGENNLISLLIKRYLGEFFLDQKKYQEAKSVFVSAVSGLSSKKIKLELHRALYGGLGFSEVALGEQKAGQEFLNLALAGWEKNDGPTARRLRAYLRMTAKN